MATVTETRDVKGCAEVALRGYGQLSIEQRPEASGHETIEVEADEQLMAKIMTEVRGSRLVLGFSMPWYEWLSWWFQWLFLPSKSIRYRLVTGSLDGISISGAGSVSTSALESRQLHIRISGAGRVSASGLKIGDLETRVSGSGNVELAGSADRHGVSISGSGSVRASQLETRAATVHISGAGNLSTAVRETLDVHISGAGDVRYLGTPRISQHISGAGRIRPVA